MRGIYAGIRVFKIQAPQKLTLTVLVAVISMSTSSHLVSQQQPNDESIRKTAKIINKHSSKFEQIIEKTKKSRKSCEKYYKRGNKYLLEKPNAAHLKPNKLGNYPHAGSILVVSRWARVMGLIRLRGCPDGSQITQDFEVARMFFEMGVFQYDEESMYQLGLMYINGQSVGKNKNIGLSWINMAATEWSEDAAAYLTSNGLPVPKKVTYQTKILIADATKSDNVYTPSNSAFWEWMGVISIVAIGAYASYKLAPVTVIPATYPIQQSVQPAVMSVSSTVFKTTMCPDGSYQPQGTCIICPDGTFTTASGCLMAPDGSFVGDYGNGVMSTPTGNFVPNTGSTVWCPDGKIHAGNWCHINPDGSFIGLTR